MKRKKTSTGSKKKFRRNPSNFKAKSILSAGRLQTTISQGISTIPDRIFVKLKWGDLYNRAFGAGVDDYIVRGNGANVDSAVPGHNPMGWDQWSAFYTSYRIRASAITVHWINVAAPPAFNILFPHTDPTLYTSISDGIEAPRSKLSKWLATSSRTQNTLKSYCTTAEADGVTPTRVESDDNYGAIVSANPLNQWFWHIITIASTGNATYSMTVKVTFYVEFYERVSLSGS